MPQSETQACGCIATCIQQRPMSHVIAALVPGAAWCIVCGASPAPATTTAAAACICIPLPPTSSPPTPPSPGPGFVLLLLHVSCICIRICQTLPPQTWLASWCNPPTSPSIIMRPFLAELGPPISSCPAQPRSLSPPRFPRPPATRDRSGFGITSPWRHDNST